MPAQTQLALETAIQLATTNIAAKEYLFNMLWDTTICVLGDTQDNQTVSLVNWQSDGGTRIIPFFSTPEILQQSVDQSQSYLHMNGSVLFGLTSGSQLFLNPKSTFGVAYTAVEITDYTAKRNAKNALEALPVVASRPVLNLPKAPPLPTEPQKSIGNKLLSMFSLRKS
jgi:hypothetical protein